MWSRKHTIELHLTFEALVISELASSKLGYRTVAHKAHGAWPDSNLSQRREPCFGVR